MNELTDGWTSETITNSPGDENLELHASVFPKGQGKIDTLVIHFEGVKGVARVFLNDGVPSILWDAPVGLGWNPLYHGLTSSYPITFRTQGDTSE